MRNYWVSLGYVCSRCGRYPVGLLPREMHDSLQEAYAEVCRLSRRAAGPVPGEDPQGTLQ
jgi:hypothetical protein